MSATAQRGKRSLKSPLGRIVRSGVSRRRVQAIVMTLTTALSAAASVLAAGLLVGSQAPFQHAFTAQHGSQLTAQFTGAKASMAQLASTARVAGVTAAAGPYATASLHPVTDSGASTPPGLPMGQLTVVGRPGPGGPSDDVDLMSGTWATGPGQIVMNTQGGGWGFGLGAHLTLPDLPGDPTMTVVGLANSVSNTADAWVTPAQLGALTAGTTPEYQMLYRFAHAATDTQVDADRSAIAAALPAGALTGTQSWLAVQLAADGKTRAFVPFVAAFGILALAMSVLIVGIVVSGAVSSQIRRIGILKSLGFTPAQVVRAYILQALIPALAGAGLGLVAGNLLAIPALAHAESAYGTGTLTIPVWIDAAVAAALLALVTAAAWVPALRAGQLRTVDAIAVGRTPAPGRGRLAHRLANRLPLSRPVAIGLANPFTRPGRSGTMTSAILLGAVAVAFAAGLATSLGDVQNALHRDKLGDVTVAVGEGLGGAKLTPVSPKQVTADIAAQPGTSDYYATSQTQVGVAGVTGGVPVVGYTGDTAVAAYQMIAGSWFAAPGQAVVPTRFLKATGTTIGDSITLTEAGHQARLRITGEALDTHGDGMQILTDQSSLDGLRLGPEPQRFSIRLKPGTNLADYVHALNAKFSSTNAQAQPDTDNRATVIDAMEALVALLTLMIVAVAGLGVLNLVVLDTRQRIHDLGVFKALGMSPGQTIAMVLTSVAGIGLVAGIIGVPLGVIAHNYVTPHGQRRRHRHPLRRHRGLPPARTRRTRPRRPGHRPRRRRAPGRLGRQDAHPERLAHRITEVPVLGWVLVDAGRRRPPARDVGGRRNRPPTSRDPPN
ncbi:MAG TPA: FtsX-like permease family protein [Streptosporangiaceae bacterium]|nr:FtsX-like permease family protein [Streptosporangiaceae bacterium]